MYIRGICIALAGFPWYLFCVLFYFTLHYHWILRRVIHVYQKAIFLEHSDTTALN